MNEVANTARCPECGVVREVSAASCHACGLLFVTSSHPHRRESDLARRAADLTKTSCPVCRGAIESSAKRCPHCGEILDSAYRAARARQLRAQVNYASWIAYILGFLMLFVFRPVGVISIVAGLLLSIGYYAIRIPAEERDTGEEEGEADRQSSRASADAQQRFARFMRRQFGVETVHLGSNRRTRFGLVVAGTPLLLVLIGWATNYTMLQIPIDQILASRSEFPVLEIAAHYEYFVVPGSVVLEIEKLGDPRNAERALTQIAGEFDEERVEIRFGDNSIRLDGSRFRELTGGEIREIVETLTPEDRRESSRPGRSVRIAIEVP